MSTTHPPSPSPSLSPSPSPSPSPSLSPPPCPPPSHTPSHFLPLEPFESIRILLAAITRRTDIVPDWHVLRTKSILIHGPPQVGKATLVHTAASELGLKIINLKPWRIVMDYPRGGLWPERAFDIYFEDSLHQPSLILIQGIDVLFPHTENEGGGSNDTFYTNALISQFLTFIDRICREDEDVVVIGTTNRIESLNPTIRSRFEDEIEVDGPAPSQRALLLSKHLQSIPNFSGKGDTGAGVDVGEIGSHTHGYMPGDIAALVRDAALLALSRVSSEESLTLQTADFVQTCKSHPPHNLSGLALQGIPKIRFEDIGGLEGVKESLKEVVIWANSNSEKLTSMRIRPPRGVLLYGPPGTGKTMLAKAVANEAAANFISVNITDLSHSEVGESEKALMAIFRRANTSRPCVIFLDEVQALFMARSSGKSNTLHSQLVLELDNALDGVIILAATNCPSAIDVALLRPGRFDLLLFIPPPTLEGRKSILSKAFSRLRIATSVNVEAIAENSEGFTGADLNNLCNTASLLAMREAAEQGVDALLLVTQAHLEKVLQNTLPSVTQEMVDELREWNESRK